MAGVTRAHQKRKNLRLPEYDYTSPGAYFVTISCYKRLPLFGKLGEDKAILNELGQVAKAKWFEIPRHFKKVALDAFIVMPSHVHGILFVVDDLQAPTQVVGAQHAAPQPNHANVKPGSLGAIIRSYKSAVSKQVHELLLTSGPIWQRNYYERVIRSYKELEAIRTYVEHNNFKTR